MFCLPPRTRVIVYDRFGLHQVDVQSLLSLPGVDYYPFTRKSQFSCCLSVLLCVGMYPAGRDYCPFTRESLFSAV
jgi:hypothetical protein